jgi:hypothetical protein
VHAAAGSLGNPSIAFNADQTTGLYRIGPSNIGVAAGGAKVLDVATTGLGVTGTLSVSGVATLGAGAILNTPASATLTNATGLPLTTGVTGTLPVTNGGTGVTTSTGSGANVLSTSPTLTTPISATLTSPAGNNLTLAAGGTNQSVILTPSGTGGVGIGTASPGSKLEVVGVARIGSSAGTNFPTYRGSVVLQDSEVVGPQATGGLEWVTNASSGSGYGWKQYTSSATGNLSIADRWNSATWTERVTFAGNTGNVSILSSTAGSSGAGALVVTGGLSAGGASYFGGAVTVSNAITSTGASAGLNVTGTSGAVIGTISSGSTIAGSGQAIVSLNVADQAWSIRNAVGAFQIRDDTAGSYLFAMTKATGAATFAGAVSITGNVGFYGQAATAKPTGVAVTAAAIHAALVTLNLIAA